MMDEKLLNAAGIDYRHGVERFMNNTALYEKLLSRFPEDNEFEKAQQAFNDGDYEQVFRSLHGMKSVTGTLDITDLYNQTCKVVEVLRVEKYDSATDEFNKVMALYHKAVEAIMACR